MKVFLAAALLAATAGADSRDVTRPCWQNLTSEARNLLSEWAKAGESWKCVSPRTRFFVRGQFFYGLERSDYIHRWYERPLQQDTSLAKFNESGHMLNPKAWKLNVDTAKEMKLDGFGFFPTNPGCMDLIPRSVLPGAEITMFPQLLGSNLSGGMEKAVELAEKLHAMPNAFRIGGRTLLITYPELSWQRANMIEKWKLFRDTLVAKHGPDAFAVMPCIRIFNGDDTDRPQMTAETLVKTRERLRQILTDLDGLYYLWDEFDWVSPSRFGRPHDEIAVPMIRSLMAEPAFRGKLLGFEFQEGHENTYRRFSEYPSGGLRRLRAAMRSMMAVGPDFIFGAEWDEENENTHFQPTVSNGRTTQRVMRYYRDLAAGEPPSPYPGDDTSVPNLILSYRKTLVAGEGADAQVVNVPDGTRGAWRVGFRWLDANGRPVKEFPERELSAESCDEISFDCPSAELLSARILRPELTVTGPDGRSRMFIDGFWPMNVEAVRNLDSKWVRHALRDMPSGITGSLELKGRAGDDGSLLACGHVAGPKRFRSIEVLEDSDTVFMQGPGTNDSLSLTHVSAKVSFMAMPDFWKCHTPTGTVRLVGAPHATVSSANNFYMRRKGMTWFVGYPVKTLSFANSCLADIPFEDVNTAAFEIDLPGLLPPTRVAVRDLMKRGAYSFALPHGGQIAVACSYSVRTIPEPPMVRERSFAFRVKPINPSAVLRLQAVDEDGRVWRGPAVSPFKPTGGEVVFRVYDEMTGEAREVRADRGLVYAPRYDFASANGDLVYPTDGRLDSPCVLGGGIGLVTGVGTGGCSYHHAVRESRPPYATAPGGDDIAPKVVRLEDGTGGLAFTNCNFATLPNHFIPRYAGFVLRMRVRPDGTAGKMGIMDSRNLGFSLSLEDGVPVAFLSLGNAVRRRGVNATAGTTVRGPALKPGVWNDLRVVFDQTTAHIEVDGVAGESRPCRGYEMNPGSTAFGLAIDKWAYFHGRLADLSVDPL